MKLNSDMVERAMEFACDHINLNLDPRLVYHDLSHTVSVVKHAGELATKIRLSKQERRIVQVAAWFHDTGYTKQEEGHEECGAQQAESFLRNYNIDEEEIIAIKECILATKCPQMPKSKCAQVLCDADLYYLGTREFFTTSERLREEWLKMKGETFSEQEWLQLNINFLSKHRYHTDYGQQILNRRKEKNIKTLQQKLATYYSEYESQGNEKIQTQDNNKQRKQSSERLERGVETLFKTASGNHMRLSGMADNKAHILLSVNSIIISIILSVLGRKIAGYPHLLLPTVLLLVVSVTTVVFAVLATKPKISKGTFTEEQIDKREVNLLFFGNFHQMELQRYEWGIREVMYDKEYLYMSMTKDIYFLGKVLAAKYRYLSIGYCVFMYGLIASVIAFGICFLLATHQTSM
jgi:predicted metal-dependent HD superfamily phosphohydrolase